MTEVKPTIPPTRQEQLQEHIFQDLDKQAREDLEFAVSEQLARLLEVPATARNLSKRRKTILEIAHAEADPLLNRNDAFGVPGVVNQNTFYNKKKDWYAHPHFRSVLDAVIRLYVQFETSKLLRLQEAERSAHRQRLLQVGHRLVDTAELMAQYPLTEVEDVQTTYYEDGRIKDEVTIIRPTNWSMSNAGTLYRAGAATILKAIGDDNTGNTGDTDDLYAELADLLVEGHVTRAEITKELGEYEANLVFARLGDGMVD